MRKRDFLKKASAAGIAGIERQGQDAVHTGEQGT